VLDDAAGYGRIVRDASGSILRVVERKDANDAELALREINTGFIAAPAHLLKGWLRRLTNDNAQGEYYLTDIVGMAAADGITIADRSTTDLWEISGINSRGELAQLERIHQKQQAEALMAQGVTLRDPARFDLRGELSAGRDVEIDVNVILEGKVTIGDRVSIGANVVIRNSTIGEGATIRENCVVEGASIGNNCIVGPFARIRPDTALAENVHVGNFVEIKKSTIGAGSKVNHLSYIGDTTMGGGVNIGAGTITANYDGVNKHPTRIGDDASVGSNSVLVAPVSVGDGSTLGAGTVLRKDAPDGELTVSAGKQKTIAGWKRPGKKQ
jgi:bifunctional UDP-N-acetylglucosamine pyrophosphorylase/glucosamine-1-phosphate N-acetyltransferase